MKNITAYLFAGLIAVLMIMISCLYTVHEGQHAILLKLGRIVEDGSSKKAKVFGPGLHIKWPFIETVRYFDTRLQTLDIKSSRIVTKEKKDVIVDYYVKWKISDLGQYFISTGGNAYKAETLLEQQLNTFLRAAFGKLTIPALVSSHRNDVMDELSRKAEIQARDLGIHVIDARIKGIELPDNTSHAIYQRMRADMQKIANRHRADGQAQAEEIRAQADAKVTILLATANSQSQTMRAKGEAEAATIYAEAYNQNPEFYRFYKSLTAYKTSLINPKGLLVLDQSSDFFTYFKHPLNSNKPR